MARYGATVESSKSPEAAFDYMADLSNARAWDPGVVEAERVDTGPLGVGGRFRVVSRFLGREIPLEYCIVEYDRPRKVVLQADAPSVCSTDEIRFLATGSGTQVTYDADLRLKGRLTGFLDPLLGLVFRRMGDRAAAGLRRELDA